QNSPVVRQTSPVDVARQFLTAWDAGDTEAMYRLTSARSQAIYAFETFDRVYNQLASQLGEEQSVTFDLGEPQLQGTSAALRYAVTIQSSTFGEIVDEGRIMRLVQESDQWRVAWSTMDIFDGYTADATLSVEREAQRRANIFDRDGDILVQEGGTVSVIYVQQNLMNGAQECSALLADLMYEPIAEMRQEWSRYDPVTIFYVGDLDQATEIEYRERLTNECGSTRDNGLILTRNTRAYRDQGAVVHVTGYSGQIPADPDRQLERLIIQGNYGEGDLLGLTGVERQFELQLAGDAPRVLRITEPGGVVLRELGRVSGTPPQPVYLTVDDELQVATSRAVAWGYNYAANNWAEPGRSDGGGAVVLDVNTGAILAMTSFPTFQPGLFNSDSFADNRGTRLAEVINDPRTPLTVRPTQESYAPGSVYKIVTTAAVLNEGITASGNVFDCTLQWDGSQAYGDTISPRFDWRFADGLEATGPIVPSQALTASCNPFYYEFGARMFRDVGAATLVDYTRLMGINGLTGIGVYPEAPGTIPVPQSVDAAISNSVGQGDTQTTIMQMA
ncbi:MAG: penicillin-binding transpeptidase domain-containing protein, partial [Chloroflexota bacterium]